MLGTRLPGADEMDAYERVLGDAMDGDATLFAREDYVEEAWRIVDPVLTAARPSTSTSRARGGPGGRWPRVALRWMVEPGGEGGVKIEVLRSTHEDRQVSAASEPPQLAASRALAWRRGRSGNLAGSALRPGVGHVVSWSSQ